MCAWGIFSLLTFQDQLFDGAICGNEVMKMEFSELSGYETNRWEGGIEKMTEARTADLWL